MPNWCYNRLTIDTTTEDGKKLSEAFKPKYQDEGDTELYAKPFQDLRPCPEDLEIVATSGNGLTSELKKQYEANIAKYGYSTWYDWRVANWGTKWDARVEEFNDTNPEQTYVYFETAWSPPTDFFKWFVDHHPKAYFRNEYDEEGMFFEGFTENSKKDGFVDECYEMEHKDD